jgi:hypothetical protein
MTGFRWRIYIPTTRDDERREVVESVLEELQNPALDAEGRAACAELLDHLARH